MAGAHFLSCEGCRHARLRTLTEKAELIYPVVDKMQIVATLAGEKAVERMVENIARKPLTPELKDLVQMVYVILLEYDAGKVEELWNCGEISFFIARIILNQYRSNTSQFYYQIRQFAKKSIDLTEDYGERE